MSRFEIQKQATFAGEWHLPSEDTAQVKDIAGTLTWQEERARLELHDSFTPIRSGPVGRKPHRVLAIHGTTLKSTLVSMLDAWCYSGSFSIGPGGFRTRDEFTGNLVVVGAHVGPQTLYSEVRMRIPALHLWLGPRGMSQTFVDKTESTPIAVVVRYEGVAEEVIAVPKAECSIGWGLDRHSSGDMASKITISTSSCIRLHPDTPKPLDWFFTQAASLSTLLSLMTGSAMGPTEITAKTENNQNVDVLVSLLHNKVSEFDSQNDFFLRRDTLGISLEDVVRNWYAIYDEIELPAKFSVSILQSKDLWVNAEFLSLMQAMEGLHRAMWPSMANTKRTLSLRLADLVGTLDEPLRRLILKGDQVPDSWIKTRNYYTHWLEKLRPKILSGTDILYACTRLRILLRVLFLKHIGVPQDFILKGLDTPNREVQYLRQLS